MDKIEALKELLKDPEVKSTLKNILLEDDEVKLDPPKKKRGRPKGSTNKKKATVTKTTKPVEEDPNYYVTEDGTVIDLSKIKLPEVQKQPRKRPSPLRKKKCERCQKEFEVYGTGYLCDKCLRG